MLEIYEFGSLADLKFCPKILARCPDHSFGLLAAWRVWHF